MTECAVNPDVIMLLSVCNVKVLKPGKLSITSIESCIIMPLERRGDIS